MNHYEILLLISSTLTDEEAAAQAVGVSKRIQDAGGRIEREEHLGKRKLAYPIEHQKNGFYELIEFEIDPTKLSDVEAALRLEMEAILRHQVVRKIVRSPEVIAAERELQERIRAKRVAAAQVADAKPAEPEPAPVPQTEEERKASLEKLDEKLDQLLIEDIVK
jgi:small subunit ribosomal protein S6